jgi:plasmid stabilization system protein ParE
MAQLIYTRSAFADLRRIHDAIVADDPTLAANLSALIRQAVGALARTPLLGRAAEGGLRERAISRGKTGYVALYRYLELDDTVLVLAIRPRSEAGYPA